MSDPEAPASENDSWLKSTLGIDVSSVLGDLGSMVRNDTGAPPQSDAGAPSNGSAQAPPAAGPPSQFIGPVDTNTSGVVTIPEVTVVGDPKAGQAYQTGFQDGLTGTPTNRAKIEQSAPGPTVILASYDDGFRDGKAKAADDLSNKGPSIGPAPPPEKKEEEDDEHPILEKGAEEGLLHGAEHILREAGVGIAHGTLSLVEMVVEIALGPGDTHVPEVTQWFSKCDDDSHGFFNSDENCGPSRTSVEEAQKDADEHNRKFPGHSAKVVKKGFS